MNDKKDDFYPHAIVDARHPIGKRIAEVAARKRGAIPAAQEIGTKTPDGNYIVDNVLKIPVIVSDNDLRNQAIDNQKEFAGHPLLSQEEKATKICDMVKQKFPDDKTKPFTMVIVLSSMAAKDVADDPYIVPQLVKLRSELLQDCAKQKALSDNGENSKTGFKHYRPSSLLKDDLDIGIEMPAIIVVTGDGQLRLHDTLVQHGFEPTPVDIQIAKQAAAAHNAGLGTTANIIR